jgi:hypothetical protein
MPGPTAYLSHAAIDTADAILLHEARWSALLSGHTCADLMLWDIAGHATARQGGDSRLLPALGGDLHSHVE